MPEDLPLPKQEIEAVTYRKVDNQTLFKHDSNVSSLIDAFPALPSPKSAPKKVVVEVATHRQPVTPPFKCDSDDSSHNNLMAMQIRLELQPIKDRIEAQTERVLELNLIDKCSDSGRSNLRKPPSSATAKSKNDKKKLKAFCDT